jgi:hypothetical protein
MEISIGIISDRPIGYNGTKTTKSSYFLYTRGIKNKSVHIDKYVH